jgi:hypothetical protein
MIIGRQRYLVDQEDKYDIVDKDTNEFAQFR